MEEKLLEKVENKIKEIIDTDININNLDHLYKLTKIKHLTKEDEEMYGNYGNYGRGSYGRERYGEYGEGYGAGSYGEYGARGRRGRYRGQEYIDRMAGEYGRYSESRNRYGAGEESDKSFHYMAKALEDFIQVLYEEAETEPQKQMLRETLQRSMR